MDRRAFLAASAAMAAAAWVPRLGAAPAGKTRLILLGTAGGPRPKKGRMASAQVIIINDVPYVVDCADGVARQLVIAGVPLPKLRHVFITHHHSDHNAGYGNLLLLAWSAGLRTRVDAWGPPPIEKITRLFLEMSAPDIDVRIADQGSLPLAPLIHVHELTAPGLVMQDENVKVTSALVDHPPVTPAFAYRFDSADRSIVISGDTNRSDNLVRLAQGADVLVHEALWVPAVDRLVDRSSDPVMLKKHLIDSHTSVEDCGRVAAAAGVKTLVLSHLVPADDPAITEQMWVDAARPYFKGEIIVGRDLMEILIVSYELVFDVGRQGPQYWWLLAIPVTMAVVGIAALRNPRSKGNRVFLTVFTVFAALVGLFFGARMAREYAGLRAALASGHYRVVEGTVTGFVPASGGDHHPERFTVITATGSVDYAYSWAMVTQGFNQSRPHDGPMRDGLRVRIADVNGEIARLEIAR